MELYRRLYDVLNTGKKAALVTITNSSKKEVVGGKILVDDSGIIKVGEMSREVFKVAKELAQEVFAKNTPFSLEKRVCDGLDVEFFVETIAPAPKAILFGGGHVSFAVAEMLNRVGFSITIVDDRSEFASKERFPFADKILCCSFQEAIQSLEIDGNTYVIIMTRGHLHDYECLAGVLNSEAKYIGMIGSRRKVKLLKERLNKEGFTEERISSIYAPIGLDIGAETPGEIAISIVAELIAIRRGKFKKEPEVMSDDR